MKKYINKVKTVELCDSKISVFTAASHIAIDDQNKATAGPNRDLIESQGSTLFALFLYFHGPYSPFLNNNFLIYLLSLAFYVQLWR